ncbi:MAG: hypothetical protein C4B58_09585 [Deltaproteobacteria bacterium]|nr:MAG: hypothetical protein C4B58_09585 [Deltaproteobacteria bacterium]
MGTLVINGWHSFLVKDWLQKKNIPYLIITPKFETTLKDHWRYRRAVYGEKTRFEKDFERRGCNRPK